jgi:transposase
MARGTRAVSHLSAEEIKQRLKHASRPWCRQRWLIISHALIEPRKAEEIAKHCGVSKATVHQVICTYNRLGVEAVETAGRGGRRHEYLSVEEEKQLLAPDLSLVPAAERSPQLPRSSWRVRAQVGHEVAESTIYRLLDRHGWRPPHAAPETPQRE